MENNVIKLSSNFNQCCYTHFLTPFLLPSSYGLKNMSDWNLCFLTSGGQSVEERENFESETVKKATENIALLRELRIVSLKTYYLWNSSVDFDTFFYQRKNNKT